jgi:hypothetical protein
MEIYMVSIDYALDVVMQLPEEERSYLLDVLQKRQAQNWRIDTVKDYQSFLKEIDKDNIKQMSAKKAIQELHEYLDSPD